MELKNRITGSDNLGAIFNVFHDGIIVRIVSKNGNLHLVIGISYLAERINPTYQFFYVTLQDVQSFTYTPWGNILLPETSILTDPDHISTRRLEILSSIVTPKDVEVLCLQNARQGGTLAFNVDYAIVRDQGGETVSLAQLIELAEGYWSGM